MTEWLAASQVCCPLDNLPIEPHPHNPHSHQEPIPAIITSLPRNVSHPMLQRRVKGGTNMPLTKATLGGKDNDGDKLKFGVAGTKLMIRYTKKTGRLVIYLLSYCCFPAIIKKIIYFFYCFCCCFYCAYLQKWIIYYLVVIVMVIFPLLLFTLVLYAC